MPVVQVLGTRSEYPGREIAIREGDLNWLEDMPFDRPFEPGGEVLFGFPDQDDPAAEPGDDYWLAHPLAEGADSLYRFRSGDTLTLSFPDGRRLRAIQLDVLAREADSHRISGSLWIDHESGALVRAVYRLSREFDAMRDIGELREEGRARDLQVRARALQAPGPSISPWPRWTTRCGTSRPGFPTTCVSRARWPRASSGFPSPWTCPTISSPSFSPRTRRRIRSEAPR